MSTDDELRRFFADIEARLISVKQAADLSGFQPSYIRRLLVRGTIPGVRLGRDWWTTREAIEAYMKTERRPGPKTD